MKIFNFQISRLQRLWRSYCGQAIFKNFILLIVVLFLFLPLVFVKADTCQNECSYSGQHECSISSGRLCGNYDSDSCLEFQNWQSCDSLCYYCGDGICNSNCGETSDNCSGDCSDNNRSPSINVVSNLELWSGATVTLSAKVSDPESEPLSYDWSCNNGYLGRKDVLNPVYIAPEVKEDTTYYCTLTAKDYRGASGSATVTIKVKKIISIANIWQTLRNATKEQGDWQKNISVNPGDIIEFKIEIKANEDSLNILIFEVLPYQVSYNGNLKLDGKAIDGSLLIGLQIGDLKKGKSKTITFEGKVLPINYFDQENTSLSAIGKVRASYMLEAIDKAWINVLKSPIQLAVNESQQAGVTSPTAVNTGITNRIIDSLLLPLFISLIILFIFKSKIISFDEWLDRRKEKIRKYLVSKTLKSRIKHIKTHEKEIYETWKS